MVCVAGKAAAPGVGLTTTTAVIGAPAQPLAVGVMVKVTSAGRFIGLVSEPVILPVPIAGIPVTGILSFAQI